MATKKKSVPRLYEGDSPTATETTEIGETEDAKVPRSVTLMLTLTHDEKDAGLLGVLSERDIKDTGKTETETLMTMRRKNSWNALSNFSRRRNSGSGLPSPSPMSRRNSAASMSLSSLGSGSEATSSDGTCTRLVGSISIPRTTVWGQKHVLGNANGDSYNKLGEHQNQCCTNEIINGWWFSTRSEVSHIFSTLRKHPRLLIPSFIALVVLTTASVMAVDALKRNIENDLRFKAEQTAHETAEWFRDEFRRALLPLYSIQQAVVHSPHFQYLSQDVGRRDAIGSAPTIPGPRGAYDYRDVTGICDDSQLQQQFDAIVEGVNKANDVDGCIVQYRLAPHAVFCLVSPKVNDKDFGPDKVFDASGAIGWDLLHTASPRWQNTVRSTIRQSSENNIDIFGPMEFAPKDNLLIPELYCAHLAVDLPGNSIIIDGAEIESWGFVMSFIHWEKFKARSDIYERFKAHDMEFQLTRTDRILDPGSGEWDEQVNVIAESENAGCLVKLNSLEVSIQTVNGEWVNRVGIIEGFTPSWYMPVLVMVILLDVLLASLFLCTLIERKLHKNLLYRMLPQRVIKKLQRGLTVAESYPNITIFFSDIVGFTSLAGEMNAFLVMDMLNDLYNKFDLLVEKHEVYKVETIGDSYMVVGGAPSILPSSQIAAQRVALFALEAIEVVKDFESKRGDRICIRAGLHSGPVMAGVVGTTMPRYCFFGDTVNTGSRMESTSTKGRIQCSQSTKMLLTEAPDYDFDLEQRITAGTVGVLVKGKGRLRTWWIEGATKLKLVEESTEVASEDKFADMRSVCQHSGTASSTCRGCLNSVC